MENNNIEETIVMVKPQKPNPTPSKKPKRYINFTGIIGVLILLVIGVIVFNVYQSFTDRSGAPVVGKRFENSLVNKIEQQQLSTLTETLKIDGVENVEVNLTSATLRITVDMNDQLDKDTLLSKLTELKDLLYSVLPADTYFTNIENTKMYDYEIHVYNVMQGSDATPKVYVMMGKTGSGKEYQEVLSEPKDASIAEQVQKKEE